MLFFLLDNLTCLVSIVEKKVIHPVEHLVLFPSYLPVIPLPTLWALISNHVYHFFSYTQYFRLYVQK